MIIAISGMPGSGKTTLVKEIAKEFGLDGVITEEIRVEGKRVGFKIVTLHDEELGILAHVDFHGPRVGKYGVNIDSIKKMVEYLKNLKAKAIVIDEYGRMELLYDEFAKLKPKADVIIYVVHRAYFRKFKADVKFWLTRENYDDVKERIRKILKKFLTNR